MSLTRKMSKKSQRRLRDLLGEDAVTLNTYANAKRKIPKEETACTCYNCRRDCDDDYDPSEYFSEKLSILLNFYSTFNYLSKYCIEYTPATPVPDATPVPLKSLGELAAEAIWFQGSWIGDPIVEPVVLRHLGLKPND